MILQCATRDTRVLCLINPPLQVLRYRSFHHPTCTPYLREHVRGGYGTAEEVSFFWNVSPATIWLVAGGGN